MRIKLKREHVLNGGSWSNNCPFYLAITEACPSLKDKINVGSNEVYERDRDNDLFENPPEMIKWIQEFDNKFDIYDNAFRKNMPLIEVDLPLEEYCG